MIIHETRELTISVTLNSCRRMRIPVTSELRYLSVTRKVLGSCPLQDTIYRIIFSEEHDNVSFPLGLWLA